MVGPRCTASVFRKTSPISIRPEISRFVWHLILGTSIRTPVSSEKVVTEFQLSCKHYRRRGRWGDIGNLHVDFEPLDKQDPIPDVELGALLLQAGSIRAEPAFRGALLEAPTARIARPRTYSVLRSSRACQPSDVRNRRRPATPDAILMQVWETTNRLSYLEEQHCQIEQVTTRPVAAIRISSGGRGGRAEGTLLVTRSE